MASGAIHRSGKWKPKAPARLMVQIIVRHGNMVPRSPGLCVDSIPCRHREPRGIVDFEENPVGGRWLGIVFLAANVRKLQNDCIGIIRIHSRVMAWHRMHCQGVNLSRR